MSGPVGSSQWMYSAGADFTIPYSCRFDSASSTYLNWTAGTPTNQKIWTYSCWVKRGDDLLEYNGYPLLRVWDDDNNFSQIAIQYHGAIDVAHRVSGTFTSELTTSALLRDPSAWYHILVKFDSTPTTPSASNFAIYINGEIVTALSTENYPSQNEEMRINQSGKSHRIEQHQESGGAGITYGDGYLAEVHFIDGTALTPTSFGETGDYGEWKPKKVSGLTYGNNGFYLDFSDSSALGDDAAGSNDWTVNNLTAVDQMIDTPTNNFCTMNPNFARKTTLQEGNLVAKSETAGAIYGCAATFLMLSGKWYWEYVVPDASGSHFAGVAKANQIQVKDCDTSAHHWMNRYASAHNKKVHNNVATTISGGNADGDGHILQIAFDADAGKIWFGKHNTWADSGDPAAGSNECFSSVSDYHGIVPTHGDDSYGEGMIYNFGQDSSFAGAKTAQGNQDSNDIGDFYYTPPTNFLALCTSNLPTPAVIPSEHFQTVLYTGTGSAHAITGVGFQPDLLWVKSRSATLPSRVTDVLMGATNSFTTNDNFATDTDDVFDSLDSDGFTVGAHVDSNTNTATYVAWNWKAGGSGSANTAGSRDSTVSVNTDAGFSIATWTGDEGADDSVGHGLSKAPEWIFAKARSDSYSWAIYTAILGNDKRMQLNSGDIVATDTDVWAETTPTSTVFSIGTDIEVNWDDRVYGAYCFHSVEGFSKFGTYVANGDAAEDSYDNMIYTGFRPKFLMVKQTTHTGGSGTGNWCIVDTERDTYNPTDARLEADTENSVNEDGRSPDLDLYANGFKIRCGASEGKLEWNWTGITYLWIAFAETPFKYANAR